MPLRLVLATGPYDRTRAFSTGDVRVEGAEVRHVTVDDPPELFTRMVRDGEFDVAEMSLGYYLTARAERNLPFIAIPVFPSRMFRHGFVFVSEGGGIRTPPDLAGRRIGLRGYRQSAAVWIRGILRDEHGVELEAVKWVEGGVNEPRPREPTLDIRPPGEGPDITFAPEGSSLDSLLTGGRIDALLGAQVPRSLGDGARRLFPDYRATEREYFKRTGIYPPMHTIVIRQELHDRNPWLAESLYKAFEDAKAWAGTQMRYVGALRFMLPWLLEEIEEIDSLFGGDPFPYGLEANRKALETFAGYLVRDRLLTRPVAIETLFAPIVAQEQKGAPVTG